MIGAVLPKEEPRLYQKENLRERFDSVVGQGNRSIEELESLRKYLPRVSPDGRSECPFAEDPYTQKEEKEAEVERRIGVYREYARAIEEELPYTKRTVAVVEEGNERLHHEQPKDHFDQAELEAKAEYKRIVDQRQKMQDLLARMQQALDRSRSIQFPGRKPRKQFVPCSASTPLQALPLPGLPGRPSTAGGAAEGFQREMNGLLSLGPSEPNGGGRRLA